jgi:hypothetical protein
MKKIYFICIVSLWATTNTNAQMRDTTLNMNTHKVDANSLFQKSKKQKTIGFILLGGGAALELVAIAIASNDLLGTILNEKKAENRVLLIAGGGAAMLSSIPFFIASGHNRAKANILLKNETLFFNPKINIKDRQLAVGVKINL